MMAPSITTARPFLSVGWSRSHSPALSLAPQRCHIAPSLHFYFPLVAFPPSFSPAPLCHPLRLSPLFFAPSLSTPRNIHIGISLSNSIILCPFLSASPCFAAALPAPLHSTLLYPPWRPPGRPSARRSVCLLSAPPPIRTPLRPTPHAPCPASASPSVYELPRCSLRLYPNR